MSEYSIVREKYRWMTPDMLINDAPGESIGLRGQALYSYEQFGSDLGMSANLRKYVDDEVREAARTLQNMPVDVNHQFHEWVDKGKIGKRPVIAGNVEYGYYEDGAVEYFAKIKNKEYIEKLRDTNAIRNGTLTEDAYRKKWGKGPIRGVSVEADFLHLKCTHCGDKFYDFTKYKHHMEADHHVKEITIEPHGIFFKGLSLVESPETPGVPTTFEIMETEQPMLRLYEMLVLEYQDKTKHEENNTLSRAAVTQESTLAFGRTTIREQDSHECPDGEHWDTEQEQCVPTVSEQDECPEGQHRDPDTGNCVDDAVSEQEEPCPEGQHRNDAGECVDNIVEQDEDCPEGQHRNDDGECVDDISEQEECPEGQHRNEAGDCVDDAVSEQETCPDGQHRNDDGECVDDIAEQEECPDGQHRNENGDCVDDIVEQEEPCPEGQHRNNDGECVDDDISEQDEPCPYGQHRNDAGECVDDAVTEQDDECLEGYHRNDSGECVPDTVSEQEDECPEGQHRDPDTGECVPHTVTEDLAPVPTPPPIDVEAPVIDTSCPENMHWDKESGTCLPDEMPKITVEQPTAIPTPAIESLTLGEPFADYTSFEDCVSKNADKDDPEAYCAEIQQQTEEPAPITEKKQPRALVGIQRMMERQSLEHGHIHEDLAKQFSATQRAMQLNNKKIMMLRSADVNIAKNQKQITDTMNTLIKTMRQLGAKPSDTPKIIAEMAKHLKKIYEINTSMAKKHGQSITSVRRNIRLVKQSLASTQTAINRQFNTVIKTINTQNTSLKELRNVTDKTVASQTASLKNIRDGIHAKMRTHVNSLKKATNAFNTQIRERDKTLNGVTGAINTLTTTVKDYDTKVSTLTESMQTVQTQVTEQGNEYEKYRNVISTAYEKTKTEHAEALTEKDQKIAELTTKITETDAKNLKETKAVTTRVENLEAIVKNHPVYKGKQRSIESTTTADVKRPWEDEK